VTFVARMRGPGDTVYVTDPPTTAPQTPYAVDLAALET